MRDNDAIETVEREGFTARLFTDDDPSSPREWDQLGIMVHWHRNYTLGDRTITETEREALNRGGFKLLERYLRMTEGGINVIPLGLLDHSGLHMYADGGPHMTDTAGWDSGTVGFIYANKASIDLTGAPLDSIDRQLRAEIDEYDQYLTGEVCGYAIDGPDGEDRDSCWGFIGYAHAMSSMDEALDEVIETEARESAKVAACMAI